jgi:archaellum component FlaC
MAISKRKIPTPSEIKTSSQSFTEQEINQLKDLRTNLNTLVIQLGQLQLSKIRIETQESELKTQVLKLEKEESNIAKQLSDKYGEGSIDLESGTFTPSK